MWPRMASDSALPPPYVCAPHLLQTILESSGSFLLAAVIVGEVAPEGRAGPVGSGRHAVPMGATQGSCGQKDCYILKAVNVVLLVEGLPSMHKALDLIPNTA